MHDEHSLKEIQQEWHGTFTSYAIGFAASCVLTAASFLLVASKVLSGYILVATLIFLAITQAIFQLLFFLHVGQEPKPRWETLVFYFMVMVLFIIAIGSLWIMHDLDDRMMSDMKMEMTHD